MKKTKDKKPKPFSEPKGATYAGWVNPKTGDIPLENHIKRYYKYLNRR